MGSTSPESLPSEPFEQPPRDLLFGEHRALLRSAELSQGVSRLILVALVVLDILKGSSSVRANFEFVAARIVAAAFWCLQAYMFRRSMARLEELAVQTFAEPSTTAGLETKQKVLLKPVELKPDSISRPRHEYVKDLWVSAYVNWRHERWKYSRFEIAQRLEPVAWSILLLALTAVEVLHS